MSYEIQVLNASSKIILLPDQFVSIEATLVYNNISRWVVILPYTAALLTAGINFANQVRIMRDGELLVSGKIGQCERNDGTESTITLAGNSPEKLLNDRRTVCDPTGPPYTSQAFDVQTDTAETIIKYYVNANAGPGAIPARRINGLSIEADGARGSRIKGRARFHNLLNLVRDLAARGGIGFRFNGLEFQCFTPTDRARTAVFSKDRGNLTGFKYSVKAPSANYYYAGGAGEGTSRTFHEAGDASSILACGRIETFLDCRQASDVAEMQEKIDEEIEKNSDTSEFSATLVNQPGILETFVDYNLGDQVTAIADDQQVSALVREIKVSMRKTGETITPIVGSYRATGSVLRRLKTNDAERIENLEVV